MSSLAAIEKRLTALEQQLAELRKDRDGDGKKPGWVDRVSGSFKDDPDFDEIVRLGREFRESDRPQDDS